VTEALKEILPTLPILNNAGELKRVLFSLLKNPPFNLDDDEFEKIANCRKKAPKVKNGQIGFFVLIASLPYKKFHGLL